jgi:hypothetical protein
MALGLRLKSPAIEENPASVSTPSLMAGVGASHPDDLSLRLAGTSTSRYAGLLVGNIIVMVVVTVMTMVVMRMDNHHNLRLRRVRCREAEDNNQGEQNLFHAPVSRVRK